ncbi:hypothetical protein GCM10011354_21880 [Egicoccus halophilus]|uniref:Uncharacterized protein n=1 Tax=Egicoccus halophilus TaxID=1670830 RepID=A0A8J3AEH2_9ACTN|nr:hypothetical protein GCM10011354_21880 [Egicoccus halophilus]
MVAEEEDRTFFPARDVVCQAQGQRGDPHPRFARHEREPGRRETPDAVELTETCLQARRRSIASGRNSDR